MRRTTARRWEARGALLLTLALLASAARADTLRVGAASSLREVVDTLATRFEEARPDTEVQVSFGASSVLAAQLRAGAPLDVLLLADPRIADDLRRRRDITGETIFARNRLVVLVRNGATPLASPAALGDPGIRRLAIPAAAVPVGRYAREWLAGHQLLDVLLPRAVQTEHARATLVAVDQGHVDAAIVYETDAALARTARIGHRIPASEQPDIAYVGVVSARARDTLLALHWLHFLTGAHATAILEAAGFATATSAGES